MPSPSLKTRKIPRQHRRPALRDQRGIPHSLDFTAGPDGGIELKIRGINSIFWNRVRRKAKREKVSVRSVVLNQLLSWVRTPRSADHVR